MKKVTLGFVLGLAMFHFGETTLQAQSISVDNTSKYSSGRYSWTVFLIGDNSALNGIDYVEYTLHPSFPKPVQPPVRDRGGKCAFALTSASWGEFEVKVKIGFKNGTTTQLRHWLRLLENRNQPGMCDSSRPPSQTLRRAPRRAAR